MTANANELPVVVPAKPGVPAGMGSYADLVAKLDAFRKTNPTQPLRVLITGSRDWTRGDLIEGLLRRLTPGSVIVHGGASGADSMGEYIVSRSDGALSSEVHRADWSQGRKAGPVRNSKMVALGADFCVGFPLESSKGTWDCAWKAQRAGIPTYICVP